MASQRPLTHKKYINPTMPSSTSFNFSLPKTSNAQTWKFPSNKDTTWQPINMPTALKIAPPTNIYSSLSTPDSSPSCPDTTDSEEEQELQLLDHSSTDLAREEHSKYHELRTAPLLTREAYKEAGGEELIGQYGILGSTLAICSKDSTEIPNDPVLYVNTNAPFSAIVCGVQGSGKSHSVSILLENMLIPKHRPIGCLAKPLSALVLHFGEGGAIARPSEAAWISKPGDKFQDIKCPKVNVFVSRSCLQTMRQVYSPLGKSVTVMPLAFHETDLDAQAFLSLMAVGSSTSAPLYVQIVLSILRELGEKFTYTKFMTHLGLKKRDFNPAQAAGLEQRLCLIESFLDKKGTGAPRFAAGQLTIVDLSDPFIDPASACGLFEIVTRLFVRANVETGKVLVVDEAHKYLSPDPSVGLARSLLTLTREQRHQAMRVIICTQEPTVVPPVLLDLCTVAILHRFSSPAWWNHVAKHVSADVSADSAFDKVVTLQTGQAIVLAPSALVTQSLEDADMPQQRVSQIGRRYLVIKTRNRITADGGASVLVL